VFTASASLVDAPERSAPRVLALVAPVWLVALVLGLLLDRWFGRFESVPNVSFGLPRLASILVSLLAAGVLGWVLYTLFLPLRPVRGMLVAGLEVVLTLFLAVLIAAAVFVFLAVWQVVRRADAGPPGPAAPVVAVARALTPPHS
jgi:hypothetical protein